MKMNMKNDDLNTSLFSSSKSNSSKMCKVDGGHNKFEFLFGEIDENLLPNLGTKAKMKKGEMDSN
jgi:hypothetical protein